MNTGSSSRAWGTLGKLGIFPIILLAIIVVPLAGGAAWLDMQWGFSQPDFVTMFCQYIVFGVGLPPLSMLLTALPTVLAAYIVLFGDVLQSKALVEEVDTGQEDAEVCDSTLKERQAPQSLNR